MAAQTIFLGGGCFWCLEAVYQRLKGIRTVVSGYMGGHLSSPDYNAVCEKKTGHAEVVCVEFDDQEISLLTILEVFFTIHDPTTPNRQGNDVGPQYRSVIYVTSDQQFAQARSLIDEYTKAKRWGAPIVTELQQVSESQWKGITQEVRVTFWPAEQYHQNYFRTNPSQGYCVFVVNPKVIKAETTFPQWVQ